jgi:predicted RecB family endonuclease
MYRAFKVMWLFLLVAPAALAQTAGGEVPAPAPAPVAPVLVDPLAVQKSTISGDEMLSQGREYRQQIQSITMQIQVQSQQAKADKDVIRLNCLLDKLNQVKVNANMMDQALQSLQDCVSRHDDSASCTSTRASPSSTRRLRCCAPRPMPAWVRKPTTSGRPRWW